VGLTTGWERELPAGDTLLRQGALNVASRLVHEANVMGGHAERWDDLLAADLGSTSPWINTALLLAPLRPDGVDDLVDRLDSVFARGGDRIPFSLLSPLPTPDLTSHGFELVGHPPFMVRTPGGVVPPPPEGLEVVEATDAMSVAWFEQALVDGFPIPDLQPLKPGTVLPATLAGGSLRLWVGLVNGSPVCCAAAQVSDGVNQVEMVATLAEQRGRGYGEAVTWRATLADPSLPSVLIASDPGRPVYERMGFLPVLRWTFWVRPG
jgi:hypothetical protein